MRRYMKNGFAALLMSTVLLSATKGVAKDQEGVVWQQGGLSTNQLSSTGNAAAETQKAFSLVAAAASLYANTQLAVMSMVVSIKPSVITAFGPTMIPPLAGPLPPVPMAYVLSGPITHGWNTDIPGVAIDALSYYDATDRKARWSDETREEEAVTRNMGGGEFMKATCWKEGDKENPKVVCDNDKATLAETNLHVATLENAGLEALEDVSETVLKKPEELVAATPYIQQGFNGMADVAEKDLPNGMSYDEYMAAVRSANADDFAKIDKRRKAHLQYTGITGVARADLGATVAKAEKNRHKDMQDFVGTGDGPIANAKVLSSLTLAVAQRLNVLNMLQGQQTANEAAAALQLVAD